MQRKLVKKLMTLLAYILVIPIHIYRLVGSPWVGRNFRFQPTCSQYALDAIKIHGGIKGSWMAIKRISRCNPINKCGYDPVPEKK